MKVDIGIIGALDAEVNDIIERLCERESETLSGITFYTGELEGKRVAVAKCGVGKVFAAICAEAMIIRYSPSLIVNTGVGGALAHGLRSADMVIADKLCQHDMNTSFLGDPVGLISGINVIYFETDKKAVKILKESAEKLYMRCFVGTVASGDTFVASQEEKRTIVENFSAIACEMEGAAIAQAAFVNNTPFVVIRAISDSADGNASMDYNTFMPIAAKSSAALTLELVKNY